MSRRRLRRLRPLGGLLVVTAACLVVLHQLGEALPGPPVGAPADLVAWASETNPVLVALTAVRLVALAFGYQLVASAGLAAVGSLAHAPVLLRASDLVALPGVRGLVRRAAAATLTASTMLASPALPAAGGSATLRVIGGGPRVTLTVEPPAPGTGEATLSVVPPDDIPVAPAPAPVAAPAAPSALLPPGADDATGATWTVQRGDHLWSIAARTLAERWQRAPEEAEVARYWGSVVLANDQLADPDLIFVGQPIALPPVPAP